MCLFSLLYGKGDLWAIGKTLSTIGSKSNSLIIPLIPFLEEAKEGQMELYLEKYGENERRKISTFQSIAN